MTLMRRLQDELDWPEWLVSRRFFDMPDFWARPFGSDSIHVEEYQENGTMVVRAEIAGVDPDKDIEITQSDGTLWIRAERRREKKVEDARNYRSEIHYGSFVRGIPLPSRANAENVVATYVDGVLEVRVPLDGKSPETARIPIRHD